MRGFLIMAAALGPLMACSPVDKAASPAPQPAPARPKMVGMANPASVYCIQQGGKLEIRDGEGGQYGMCLLPDGRQIEEWAFFRANNPPPK